MMHAFCVCTVHHGSREPPAATEPMNGLVSCGPRLLLATSPDSQPPSCGRGCSPSTSLVSGTCVALAMGDGTGHLTRVVRQGSRQSKRLGLSVQEVSSLPQHLATQTPRSPTSSESVWGLSFQEFVRLPSVMGPSHQLPRPRLRS